MDIGPRRDLVGDLAKAVKATTSDHTQQKLHFGLYHSLFEWYNPLFRDDFDNNFTTNNFPNQQVSLCSSVSENHASRHHASWSWFLNLPLASWQSLLSPSQNCTISLRSTNQNSFGRMDTRKGIRVRTHIDSCSRIPVATKHLRRTILFFHRLLECDPVSGMVCYQFNCQRDRSVE